MSQPQDLTEAQALKAYRRQSGDKMNAAVRAFNKMGINDRIELLYWMQLHSNAQLFAVSDAAGELAPTLKAATDN